MTPTRLAEEVTMPTKYEKLDALIIASIGKVPTPFSDINVGNVANECERIAASENIPGMSFFDVSPMRICDRRLQALRKAGKIVSTTKGWVLL